MGRTIYAPEEYTGNNAIFIGGGISNCPDWQTELIDKLKGLDIDFLNPRRLDFDITNSCISGEQIKWEHNYLRKANEILFWFCKETLCPITLYELGSWSMTNKKIFVGVEPGYKRLFDVELQTNLVRPDIEIVYSLGSLANQILQYYNSKKPTFNVSLAHRLTVPNKKPLVALTGTINGKFNLKPGSKLLISGKDNEFVVFNCFIYVSRKNPDDKWDISVEYDGDEKQLVGCKLSLMEEK